MTDEQYTADRLMKWGKECRKWMDGTLGMALVRYAKAWEQERDALRSERDELARDWDKEHYHRLSTERDRDALQAENKRLGQALREAVLWDGSDDEGVEAVWLPLARAALGSEVHAEVIRAAENRITIRVSVPDSIPVLELSYGLQAIGGRVEGFDDE